MSSDTVSAKIKSISSVSEFLSLLLNPLDRARNELEKNEDSSVLDSFGNDKLKDIAKYNINVRTFFRGTANKEWKLVPSAFRDSGNLINESSIFHRTLIDRAADFDTYLSNVDIIVKMQHYGIPTRLLDITENPLVSLYFACDLYKDENGKETDGCVWILPVNKGIILNQDSKFLDLLACLPRLGFAKGVVFPHIFRECIKSFIDGSYKRNQEEGNYISLACYMKELTYGEAEYEKQLRDYKDLPTIYDFSLLDSKIYKDLYDLFSELCSNYCFIPKRNDPRLIAQSGAFIISNYFYVSENRNIRTLHECDNSIDLGLSDQLAQVYYDYDKLIIPANKKMAIRKELEMLNITRATLFPDLQNYAVHIKAKEN